MAAPDPTFRDDEVNPPRPPVNLILNAVLQPVAVPLWWFIASGGMRGLRSVNLLGAVLLSSLFILGMTSLVMSVKRRSLWVTQWFALTYVVVSCSTLFFVMFALGTTVGPQGSQLVSEIVFGLLLAAFSFWSAFTFMDWARRVSEWERVRAVCSRCGYNLIATLHDKRPDCPECGCPISEEMARRFHRTPGPGESSHD
ncbi:MAG: hypothetical protein WD768_14880 [Phycisphaeraceae bacterium]